MCLIFITLSYKEVSIILIRNVILTKIYCDCLMVRSSCVTHPSILFHLLFTQSSNLNGNNVLIKHDMKNHKVFLKKIHYPEITVNDLYIGNILPCYGRQLKIVDFGDEFTKKNLAG